MKSKQFQKTLVGKTGKALLDLPGAKAGTAASEQVTPRNYLESLLHGLWGELLGHGQYGVTDDFFRMGGNSIKATQLISRMERHLGVSINLTQVFAHPTIRQQALLLENLTGEGYQPIAPAPGASDYPLSDSQRSLWVAAQLAGGTAAYHIQLTALLTGTLHPDIFQRALNRLVERHESLRTVFIEREGEPRQLVLSPDQVSVPLVQSDLRAPAPPALQPHVHDLLQQPFDLARGPLLRVALLRTEPLQQVLVITLHHLVGDGWSMEILTRELLKLYSAFGKGEPVNFSPLRIHYKDYVHWQQNPTRQLESQRKYWLEQLGGELPTLELPTDFARPAVRAFRGSSQSLLLDVASRAQLLALGQKQGASLFMVLVASLKALLYRYTAQRDLIIGTAIAGRTHRELEDQIGLYVNTLPLRTRIEETENFNSLLEKVKSTTLGAYQHQSYPFAKLVEELRPERSLSRSPLFDLMVVLHNAGPVGTPGNDAVHVNDELHVEAHPVGESRPSVRFDMSFNFREVPGGLALVLDYDQELFSEGYIKRFLDHYQRMLTALCNEPAQPLHLISYLSDAEREQLIERFNQPGVDVPRARPATILPLLEEQVRANPNGLALRFGEQTMSYGQLHERSNRLANYLINEQKLGPDKRVGLLLERSPRLLISMLAVLKAGATYVPLDSNYPAERIGYIVSDSQISVLLTERALPLPAGFPTLCTVWLEDIELQACAADSPPEQAGGEDLMYLLYTSGSTGKPKGVAIRHRSVVNFLLSMQHQPGSRADHVWLAVTTCSFDISVLELFLPLISGGSIVLASGNQSRDGQLMAALIDQWRPNCLQATPSTYRMLLESGWQGDPAIKLLCGGERLDRELAKKLLERSAEVWNMYGPTETTVWSTCKRISTGNANAITVGKPIADTQVYVLDSHRQIVPQGVKGEIYIGGEGVAQGYWQRPDLTEERFVDNAFGKGRLYRTGDLGRWVEGGELEVVGRADEQIKLRGHRIELGEIEQVLLAEGQIEEAAVVMHKQEEDAYLVAYLVTSLDELQVRRYLEGVLPAYMVPSYLIRLDRLPFTPNGKLDRKALPAPALTRLAGSPYQAPQNQLEAALADIFGQVLALERVGTQDNFFELGGHSLKATQVVSRIHSQLALALELRSLFTHPTVQALAALLARGKRLDHQPIAPLAPSPSYALSHAQRRLWILQQWEQTGSAYHMSSAFVLEGSLHQPALQAAFADLVARHQSLRTCFVSQQGEPRQVILPVQEYQPEWHYQDLRPLAHARQAALAIARRQAQEPFDLQRGPLLRVSLLQLGDQQYILALCMHHIISDGWSMGVFVRDLLACYQARRQGRPAALPALRVHYKDYAHWQQQLLQQPQAGMHRQYWLEQLSGELPVLELPTDFSRPLTKSFAGDLVELHLDGALVEGLKAVGKASGATLFMSLLAAVNALLYRYTGQQDIIVGSPVAGRDHLELEDQIGFFVNTLALRSRLSGQESFVELLEKTRLLTLDAYQHSLYPFDKLVDELKLERDTSRSPLFDVMVILQNAESNQRLIQNMEALSVKPLDMEKSKVSKFDLTFNFAEAGEGLVLYLEYNTSLFGMERMERMAMHLERMLAAIVQNASTPLYRIDYLSEAEKHRLLEQFNDNYLPYSVSQTIHSLLEEQVKRTPEAVALVAGEWSLTYRELNEAANRLAHYLKETYQLQPNDLVGVLVGRTPWMVIGMLAILKAGAAYVPIDTAYPEERIRFTIEDAALKAILVDDPEAPRQYGLAADAVLVLGTGTKDLLMAYKSENPSSMSGAGDACYVIYTSGSTGKPKGVVIVHQNAVSFIAWAKEAFSRSEFDVVFAATSICFDLSVYEIFYTLAAGKRIRLLNSGADIVHHLDQEKKVLINTVPSLVAGLLRERVDLSSVAVLNMAGEPVPQYFREQLDWNRMEVRNLYGPSEDTTYSSCFRFTEEAPFITIGKPIANTQFYILDQHLQLLPEGIPGEICIAGDGIARGYLNRTELTALRFVDNPFAPASRLYRTGDVGKWLPDGSVQYIGRADFQVKVNGYRIELGEVEKVLAQYPGIRETAVMVKKNTDGNSYLAAYLMSEEDSTPSQEELVRFMQEKLPAFMVPAAFVVLENFPLTQNGKLDRKKLPEPERLAAGKPEAYTAPEGEAENILAEAWRVVLGRDTIGTSDNFFHLGGDSIRAIQVISRLYQQQLLLKVSDVFQYPTIADLALRVKRQQRKIDQSAVAGDIPLTPVQAQFLATYPAHYRHHFNHAVMLLSRQGYDAETLRAVFAKLVAHHDALRITFRQDGKSMRQVNEDIHLPLHLEEHDLRGVANPQAALAKRANALQGSFDLQKGPLLKVALFHLPDADRLLIVAHHLIIDGVSWRILFEDIETLYRQYRSAAPLQLPDKTDSFKSWAEQLATYARSEACLAEEAYWAAVEAQPVLPLPKMDEKALNLKRDEVRFAFALDPDETDLLLTKVNQAFNTVINDILLTALGLALRDCFGLDRVAIALEGHGREDILPGIDISRTIGWFTAIYPVVLPIGAPGQDLSRQTKEVKEYLRQVPNKGIGYGIRKYLGCIADTEDRPAALPPQISFNYLGQFDADLSKASFEVASESPGNLEAPDAARMYEWEIVGIVAENCLRITISYSAGQYHADCIRAFMEQYHAMLREIINTCSARDTVESTPSDFTYKGLSIEVIDTLFD